MTRRAAGAAGDRAIGVVFTGGLAKQVGRRARRSASTAVTVWNIAKWPVLLLVVSFMFALLYWAAPNVKHPKFRWITPGGMLAVVTLARRLRGVRVLRAELRLLQQDLRRARRRDRLPRLAVDLEHRRPARRRVRRRAGARTAIERGHPAEEEPFLEPRDTRKIDEVPSLSVRVTFPPLPSQAAGR